MENFCKKLNKPHEETVFQQYIDKCSIFYGGSMISGYICDVIIIAGPIALDQPFPTNAEYPFDIYRQPIRSIIYIHQVICALQVASHLCINVFTSLLLWFTSARFELLTERLLAITDIYDLMKRVQEHQKLLIYAEQVVRVVRPFALIIVAFSTSTVIVTALVLVTNQPLLMKIQCVVLVSCALTEVFMHTWAAEHLIYISNEVGNAIYNAEWYKQSAELRKSVQIVLMRAQKPIIIAIPGFMPSLSLSYYASYLSTIFSYFTTLRIFIQNSQNIN